MAATDYDFSLTRNEIIETAMRIVGALSPWDALTSDQYTQGVNALNSMIKSWQAEHIYLWTLKQISISLVSGTAAYSLGTDPPAVGLDKVHVVDTSTDELPVEIIPYRDYLDIPNKTDTDSLPVYVTFNHNDTTTPLIVWPVPNASRTLKVLAVTKLKDWDSASGDGGFPVRFQEAIIFNLAARLAPEYGLPLSERRELAAQGNYLLKQARTSDKEFNDHEHVRGAF
jgi:hypothetical protein